MVVDTSGLHVVGIVFCGCVGAPKTDIQLVRVRWFPGTIKDPRSAYTFDTLNTFHILNLQGKLSLHDFYQSIHRKCDNVGVREYKVRIHHPFFNKHALTHIQDRYDQMLPIMRIWRHMKMIKRAGRGHDPKGVANTKMGQCAVECPACPSPTWNLPEGWQNAPTHKK